MQRLFQIIENVRDLNVNDLINEILSNTEIQKKILDLNRYGQLFDKGEDSLGLRLDDGRRIKKNKGYGRNEDGYAESTIFGTNEFSGKIEKGLPYDRITLFNEGDFYKSFVMILRTKDFFIEANTIKEDNDLVDDWGEEILGLSESSKEMLILWVKNEIIPKVKEFILS